MRRPSHLLVFLVVLAAGASDALAAATSREARQMLKGKNSRAGQVDRRRCAAYLGLSDVSDDISLILTADPGDFSGVSEAFFILDNLRGRRDVPRRQTVCGDVSSGEIMGQPAIVVTTGIGPSAAAMCTLELLEKCGAVAREAFYFGTSGWSPMPGGLLNPPQCSEANWRPLNITRVGDVCISPFSVNWTCKKSSWSRQARGAPNQCGRPAEDAGPADSQLFGQCMFYEDNILGNLDLADRIIDVSRSDRGIRNFPSRPLNVTRHDQLYWGAAAEGANMSLPPLPPLAKPKVWDYRTCMEVDGQFFYTGSPWELQAREYAAMTLNAAAAYLSDITQQQGQQQQQQPEASPLSSPKRRVPSLPSSTSALDMIGVSAMEAIGVSEALARYHALSSTARSVPFTNIRTNSNWMLMPLTQSSPGQWVLGKEVPDDYVNGYAYAIATGSATILSYMQDRCLSERAAMTAGDLSRSSSECSFTLEAKLGDFTSRLQARQQSLEAAAK